MDIFGGWKGYQNLLEQNWRERIAPEDTVVLAGDFSWGMTLAQSEADFAFVQKLPGQKILLKGNHDYWWTSKKKMEDFSWRTDLTPCTFSITITMLSGITAFAVPVAG